MESHPPEGDQSPTAPPSATPPAAPYCRCAEPGPKVAKSEDDDLAVPRTVLAFLLAISLFALAVSFDSTNLALFGPSLGVTAVVVAIVGFVAVYSTWNSSIARSRAHDAELARRVQVGTRRASGLSDDDVAAAALALTFSSTARTEADARSLSMRLLLLAASLFAVSLLVQALLGNFFEWLVIFALGLLAAYLAIVFLLVNPRAYLPERMAPGARWFLVPPLPSRLPLVCDAIGQDPRLRELDGRLHLTSDDLPATLAALLPNASG